MSKEISNNGIKHIYNFEKEVLRVYNDGYGFLTVGVGHKVLPNDNLRLGDTITKERSRTLLQNDLKWSVKAVNHFVNVQLTQNQFDALVSFVFNIGESNFRKSTLLKRLNTGNYASAANEFAKWVFSNGRKSNGLIRRRKSEKDLFLS